MKMLLLLLILLAVPIVSASNATWKFFYPSQCPSGYTATGPGPTCTLEETAVKESYDIISIVLIVLGIFLINKNRRK